MEAVRCEACGLKALVAASTCPHCGHLLDIRNSFGELLPLVYCTTCDVSYPARDGACRWCGSKPEKVNFRPHIWKGVGALVFVGMAAAAFLTRDDAEAPGPSSAAADSASAAKREPPAIIVGQPQRVMAVAPADSSGTPAAIAPLPSVADTAALRIALTDTGPGIRPYGGAPVERSQPTSSSLTGENATSGVAAPAADSATIVATTTPPTAATTPPPVAVVEGKPKPNASVPTGKTTARKPPPRRAVGWSNAVARSWATVRAAPSRNSRLVGSVGPDTHVQLGEVRGDWRRIRLRGMVGWVEHGRFAPRRVSTQRRAAPF